MNLTSDQTIADPLQAHRKVSDELNCVSGQVDRADMTRRVIRSITAELARIGTTITTITTITASRRRGDSDQALRSR